MSSTAPSDSSSASGLDENALLDDIKALGGDESDLKLLKSIPKNWQSESKVLPVDTKVERELKALVKSLGFEKVKKSNVKEEDVKSDVKVQQEAVEEEDKEERESKEMRKVRERVEKVERKVPEGKGWLSTPNSQWHAVDLPVIYPAPVTASLTSDQTSALKEHAHSLLSSLPSSLTFIPASDAHFISTLLSSGTSTSSDRISALTLLVTQAPLHSVTQLNAILNICRKKSREESGRAVRAIVDWLARASGLPERKLKVFEDQPGLDKVGGWAIHLGMLEEMKGKPQKRNKGKGKDKDEGMLKEEVEAILTVWAFEDFMKGWFFEVLKTIETLSHDPLPFVRNQQVSHLSLLLKSKPEQEQNILALLVNKLGDLDKSVASKASHEILQTLQFHPMMKSIIIREVANLILRPTPPTAPAPPAKSKKGKKSAPPPPSAKVTDANEHARYYGIITLNQMVLSKGKDTEAANKMIEVYFEMFEDVLGRTADEEKQKEKPDDEEEESDSVDEETEGRMNKLKRKRFERTGTGKSRKEKNRQDKATKGGPKDDNQDVGDGESKFMAAILSGVNRAFPYSNFDDELLQRRMDTLFKVTHTSTLNVMIQSLQLIYTISSSRRKVSDRFFRTLYDSLLDPRLESSSKQALYLNLVFKALKADESFERVAAFVKRIFQILAAHQPPFVCGALFLLSELFKTTPKLRVLLDGPSDKEGGEYDWRKRDPQYAHAETTCLWELTPFLTHYHPLAVHLSASLLASDPVPSSYSHLEKLTTAHLLDRFAYRSAKKEFSSKGSSLMQSGVQGQDKTGMVSLRKGTGMVDELAVNERRFWRMKREKVEPDLWFFHTYFNLKHQKMANEEVEPTKGGQDVDEFARSESEDEPDEEEEKEIWKAMKSSLPADGDLDDDISMGSGAGGEDDEDLEGFDAMSFDFSGSGSDDGAGEKFNDDEDDLLDSDEDIVIGGSDASAGEDEEAESGRRKKRKSVKNLPLFATAEEYEHLLQDSGESDG
ncbi:CBF-domain-containing protein [Atractiella rhizophila]|nr:CBF-domain-containing protein [Atractiella rhizophila]